MMERRIYPPGEHAEFLDTLVRSDDGAPPLFKSKAKALLFAAALGRHLDRYSKPDSKGVGIRFDIFENAERDDALFAVLAIEHLDSLGVLAPEEVETRAALFESYAREGLAELERIHQRFGDTTEALAVLCLAALQPASEVGGLRETDLADVLRGL